MLKSTKPPNHTRIQDRHIAVDGVDLQSLKVTIPDLDTLFYGIMTAVGGGGSEGQETGEELGGSGLEFLTARRGCDF
jgi:hypothetical protein